MSHVEQDFAGQIRRQGYRLTPQRQLILDVICSAGGHATCSDIYERVKRRAPAVNRSTIYRALAFFSELGLVVTAEIDGDTVYEITALTPHHHLVCEACGLVQTLPDDHFQELIEQVRTKYTFEVSITHMTISGLCAQCQDE